MIHKPARSPATRKFRFGVQVLTAPMAGSSAEWRETVTKADALGYDTLILSDHVGYRLGPISAIAAAGQISDRLNLSCLVFSNDFRNPVLLAQEAATIDRLTDGRFELGIGAGWKSADYSALGIAYDPPGVRLERLIQGVDIVRTAWKGEAFSYNSAQYTLTDVPPLPRPVQQPGPPIMIGGGGDRLLGHAARIADIVNISPRLRPATDGSSHIDPAQFERAAFAGKVQTIQREAGARFSDIELSVTLLGLRVDGDHEALSRMRNRNAEYWVRIASTPWGFEGSIAQIADQMRATREELGISYFVVMDTYMDVMARVISELAGE